MNVKYGGKKKEKNKNEVVFETVKDKNTAETEAEKKAIECVVIKNSEE